MAVGNLTEWGAIELDRHDKKENYFLNILCILLGFHNYVNTLRRNRI